LNGLTTSLAVKPPCRVATTANITLSGLQTINGVALAEDDRVLVWQQTSQSENGIYIASTSDWTRAKDFDGNRDVVQGTRVLVAMPNSMHAEEYEVTTANPITIDTTSITFALRYGANATYDRTAAEIAAGVTPTDYAIPSDAIGGVIVDRYGTNITPGSTSMFAPIRNAMKIAYTGSSVSGIGDHSRVEFLRNIYRIDSDTVFNDSGGLNRGMVFRGQGMNSTKLRLITGGSAKYFYKNNLAGTQQYIFITFEDLMFTTDSNSNGNGFYMQADQGFRFSRCHFQGMARMLEGNGNLNGSEHKFYACKITDVYDRVISFDNEQMLNIELHGCDVETIYGHIFYIDDGGGGALSVFGGSYIMDDGGSPHYLLYIHGAGTGGNNNRFTFNGIQTELHSTNNALVYKGTSSTAALITFNDCNLTSTQGGVRNLVDITGGRVTFNRCNMPAADTYLIRTGEDGVSSERHGDPGSIIFDECNVPSGLSYLITTGNYGFASARDCFNNDYTPGTNTNIKEAMDFDLNWQNGGRASNFPGLKTVCFKNELGNWPYTGDSDDNDWTVLLPKNALIKNIYVYRPANAGGGAGNIQLAVGNGDKTTTYASSTLAAGTSAHVITIEKTIDSLIAGGATSPNNKVRIWGSTKNSSVISGGYSIVQYY
jgi:hypothetical protein